MFQIILFSVSLGFFTASFAMEDVDIGHASKGLLAEDLRLVLKDSLKSIMGIKKESLAWRRFDKALKEAIDYCDYDLNWFMQLFFTVKILDARKLFGESRDELLQAYLELLLAIHEKGQNKSNKLKDLIIDYQLFVLLIIGDHESVLVE